MPNASTLMIPIQKTIECNFSLLGTWKSEHIRPVDTVDRRKRTVTSGCIDMVPKLRYLTFTKEDPPRPDSVLLSDLLPVGKSQKLDRSNNPPFKGALFYAFIRPFIAGCFSVQHYVFSSSLPFAVVHFTFVVLLSRFIFFFFPLWQKSIILLRTLLFSRCSFNVVRLS